MTQDGNSVLNRNKYKAFTNSKIKFNIRLNEAIQPNVEFYFQSSVFARNGDCCIPSSGSIPYEEIAVHISMRECQKAKK